MGEIQVVNKYYHLGFDPSKLSRVRRRPKNNQIDVRMMLPMIIRCNTCGNYIYSFVSREEDVIGECTKCSAELTIKTDSQNSGYVVESGAKRNFEPWRAEDEGVYIAKGKREAEEMGDLMKSLENLTLDSKREMYVLAALDELKSMKSLHATVNVDAVWEASRWVYKILQERKLEEKDEALVKSVVFRNSKGLLSVSGDLPFVAASNRDVHFYALIKRIVEGTQDWPNPYAIYEWVSFHDKDLDNTISEDGLVDVDMNVEKQWNNFDYTFQYAFCGGFLLMVGGFNDPHKPTNPFKVMHVDLTAPETVSHHSPLMKIPRVMPLGLLTVGNRLYVVGDVLNPNNRDHWMEVFDTETFEWSSIKFPDEEVLVPLPYCWFWWDKKIHLLVLDEDSDEGFRFYFFDLTSSEWRLLGHFRDLNSYFDYEFVIVGNVLLALGESGQHWAAYDLETNMSTRINGIRYPGMDGGEIHRPPDFVACLGNPWYCNTAFLRLFWLGLDEPPTIKILKLWVKRCGDEFIVAKESCGYFWLPPPDNQLVQLFATDSASQLYRSMRRRLGGRNRKKKRQQLL